MRHQQAAIDIKARRLAEGVNRLDPEYLSRWRRSYETTRTDFLHGEMHAIAFIDKLQLLGFRGDALKCEILDAERDINNPARPKPQRFFRYSL